MKQILHIALTVFFLLNISCKDNAETDISDNEILLNRAASVIASINEGNNIITAPALYKKVTDDDISDIYLLDTRPQNEWDSQGHIKYAASMQMQKAADRENLAKLPNDGTIICISPTSHTAVQVSSTLRWLGYNTRILEHGMSGWIPTHARQMIMDDIKNGMKRRYHIVKNTRDQINPNNATAKSIDIDIRTVRPVLEKTAREMLEENIFNKEFPFNHIFADDLYRRIQDPAESKDLYLLDVRPLGSWDGGYIKEAHRITLEKLSNPENLKKLPKDKLIVVICDTGITSGQVMPLLRMIGLSAVTLRSGMMAWTETPDNKRVLEELKNGNYPVVK